jgi:hypothetical protein
MTLSNPEPWRVALPLGDPGSRFAAAGNYTSLPESIGRTMATL